jgi:hypothetical protein
MEAFVWVPEFFIPNYATMASFKVLVCQGIYPLINIESCHGGKASDIQKKHKTQYHEISAALIRWVFTVTSAPRSDCAAPSCLYSLIFLTHF